MFALSFSFHNNTRQCPKSCAGTCLYFIIKVVGTTRGGSNAVDECCSTVNEGCEAVGDDDVLVGSHVTDVGCEAMDRADVFVHALVILMACETIDRGDVLAGSCVLDMGHKTVNGGEVLVNCSPSTTLPISPVTCSLSPTTFTLPFNFPSSFVSLA